MYKCVSVQIEIGYLILCGIDLKKRFSVLKKGIIDLKSKNFNIYLFSF